jgi:hypothetical protein
MSEQPSQHDQSSPSVVSTSTRSNWHRDHIRALIEVRKNTNSVKFNTYIYTIKLKKMYQVFRINKYIIFCLNIICTFISYDIFLSYYLVVLGDVQK